MKIFGALLLVVVFGILFVFLRPFPRMNQDFIFQVSLMSCEGHVCGQSQDSPRLLFRFNADRKKVELVPPHEYCLYSLLPPEELNKSRDGFWVSSGNKDLLGALVWKWMSGSYGVTSDTTRWYVRKGSQSLAIEMPAEVNPQTFEFLGWVDHKKEVCENPVTINTLRLDAISSWKALIPVSEKTLLALKGERIQKFYGSEDGKEAAYLVDRKLNEMEIDKTFLISTKNGTQGPLDPTQSSSMMDFDAQGNLVPFTDIPLNYPTKDHPFFSDDKKQSAYLQTSDETDTDAAVDIFLNGHKKASFRDITEISFSDDGRHFAFIGVSRSGPSTIKNFVWNDVVKMQSADIRGIALGSGTPHAGVFFLDGFEWKLAMDDRSIVSSISKPGTIQFLDNGSIFGTAQFREADGFFWRFFDSRGMRSERFDRVLKGPLADKQAKTLSYYILKNDEVRFVTFSAR